MLIVQRQSLVGVVKNVMHYIETDLTDRYIVQFVVDVDRYMRKVSRVDEIEFRETQGPNA